jgi:hypothetical protein
LPKIIVHSLLGLVYANVVSDPVEQMVGTSAFAVQIAPECSGYEGIGLLTVFVVAFFGSSGVS